MSRDNFGKQNRTAGKIARRAVALLLCLVTLVTSLPLTANAVSVNSDDVRTGTPVKNTYLLAINTGAKTGKIKYFNIRYLDSKGIERSELLFPENNYMESSAALAGKVDNQAKRRELVQKYTGFYPETSTCLAANSTDMYVFSPRYTLSDLVRIEVFAQYIPGETNDAWTCQDMRFYHVEKIYGYNMYGYFSGDYYVDFSGELLYKLVSGVDFALTNVSRVVSFGPRAEGVLNPDYYMEKPPAELAKYDSSKQEEFYFRLDIADVNLAGIEAFANYPDQVSAGRGTVGTMLLPEVLTVTLVYRDIYGVDRTARLPFVTSVVGWMIENNPSAAGWKVNGLFQQGDTVFFKGSLPDFESLKSCRLIYTEPAWKTAKVNAKSDSKRNERKTKITNEEDAFSYTGLSIFRASQATASISLDGAMIRSSVEGTPVAYSVVNIAAGDSVQYGGIERTISGWRTPADGPVNLKPAISQWNYIVELNTDSVANAGTKEDLFLRLHYLSQSGTEKIGEVINLREASSVFYGFWPGSNGDFSYLSGVGSGGKLVIPVSYNDVDYFTGATVFANKGFTDEWQMLSMNVYKIENVSQRFGEWKSVSIGGLSSDRNIYRLYDVGYSAGGYDQDKVLIHPNSLSQYVPFGGGGAIEEKKIDWERMQYSMSYEEATQDLGFTDIACRYQVQVKVKSNVNADTYNGDCGSTNRFFFQLIFNNGRSGYVLANQQLTADGFRAGQTETFEVCTNRNYGEVSAIHIIPEDVADDSTPYDKLNIAKIDVIRIDTEGVNRTWEFDDIGWIEIDYHDEGIRQDYEGQPGRTESELARSFTVSSTGYSIGFVFALSSLGIEDGLTYDGTLTANIRYLDNQQVLQEYSIDVARAMYDYLQREPIESQEMMNGNVSNTLYKARISPNLMLRKDTTDRFEVYLTNVSMLVDVTLFAATEGSKNTIVWDIAGLDVYQILNKGKLLQLNDNGEYQRNDKIQHICSDLGRDAGGRFFIQAIGQNNSYKLQLNPVEIKVNSEDASWEADIQNNPQNYDDKLNVYVYMSDNADSVKNYEMAAALTYQFRTKDVPSQASIKAMNKYVTNGANMFYYTGLSATGMTVLHELRLKANSTNTPTANVDYAIVQHVRSGVVINTYRLDFNNDNAAFNTLTAKPGSSTGENTVRNSKQIVTLQFSEDTVAAALSGNVADIAVSLDYTTTNALGNDTFRSKPITLAAQDIESIAAGKTVSITFEEAYIKEIKGMTLQAVGDISASIEKACIGVYESDESNSLKCTKWYNFSRTPKLTRNQQTVSPGSTSVVPLTLTLETSTAGSNYESGTNTPIKASINVTDSRRVERTIVVDDITKYLSSGSFGTGSTAVVSLLLSDVGEVRNISFRPYDSNDDNIANWSLANLEATWIIEGSDYGASRKVDTNILESKEHTVNLSNVTMLLGVVFYDESNKSYGERNIAGKMEELNLASGHSLVIRPNVKGTLPGKGYEYKVEKKDGDVWIDADCYADDEGKITFVPPENTSDTVMVYRITVSSEEDPSAFAGITINVTPVVSQPDPDDLNNLT